MGDLIDIAYLETAFDKRRLVKLVDDGSTPALRSAMINNAIAAAESEIQDILSKQYSLQQMQASVSVKRAVAIGTMYILEMRRSDISKAISLAYETSRNYLQGLVDGNAKLNAVPQVLPRITQSQSSLGFENGYFDGMSNAGDEDDKIQPTTTT